MSDDVIEKAAEVLAVKAKEVARRGWGTPSPRHYYLELAQALADAGLLLTRREWGVRNGPHIELARDEADARDWAADRDCWLEKENPVAVTRLAAYTPWKDA